MPLSYFWTYTACVISYFFPTKGLHKWKQVTLVHFSGTSHTFFLLLCRGCSENSNGLVCFHCTDPKVCLTLPHHKLVWSQHSHRQLDDGGLTWKCSFHCAADNPTHSSGLLNCSRPDLFLINQNDISSLTQQKNQNKNIALVLI